jgi:ABC-type uncharacterized transport system substrate-binding protein
MKGNAMRRRDFITLLGGAAAAAWPLTARAQQQAVPVVGYLDSRSPADMAKLVAAFRQGLSETGYVEGRNVAIEYLWAENQNDRLPALAAELTRRQVAVIVTTGGQFAAMAAKTATGTIPIVFQLGANPVQAGLVASLNRPGGNVTGLTSISVELSAKRLELFSELVPLPAVIGWMFNQTYSADSEANARAIQVAGRTLGRQIITVSAGSEAEIDQAFARATGGQRAGHQYHSILECPNESNRGTCRAARYRDEL